MRKLKSCIDRGALIDAYNALIAPHFTYCCGVWDTIGIGLSDQRVSIYLLFALTACKNYIIYIDPERGVFGEIFPEVMIYRKSLLIPKNSFNFFV